MIVPGERFTVRITPPRTGTFIYHTHLHDYRQLSSGLYGPLVVVEPGETYDPATDHVVVLGRRDASPASAILEDAASAVIDGEREPHWTWTAKTRHRAPADQHHAGRHLVGVADWARDGPVTWRPLTKDGAAVPAARGAAGPGARRRSPSARPTTSSSRRRPAASRCGSRCAAPTASGRRRDACWCK